MKRDKVVFLDKDCNVVYQAKVSQTKKGEIPKISCLNLDTFQRYETTLRVSDLQGCNKVIIESFKIYRHQN